MSYTHKKRGFFRVLVFVSSTISVIDFNSCQFAEEKYFCCPVAGTLKGVMKLLYNALGSFIGAFPNIY